MKFIDLSSFFFYYILALSSLLLIISAIPRYANLALYLYALLSVSLADEAILSPGRSPNRSHMHDNEYKPLFIIVVTMRVRTGETKDKYLVMRI